MIDLLRLWVMMFLRAMLKPIVVAMGAKSKPNDEVQGAFLNTMGLLDR